MRLWKLKLGITVDKKENLDRNNLDKLLSALKGIPGHDTCFILFNPLRPRCSSQYNIHLCVVNTSWEPQPLSFPQP